MELPPTDADKVAEYACLSDGCDGRFSAAYMEKVRKHKLGHLRCTRCGAAHLPGDIAARGLTASAPAASSPVAAAAARDPVPHSTLCAPVRASDRSRVSWRPRSGPGGGATPLPTWDTARGQKDMLILAYYVEQFGQQRGSELRDLRNELIHSHSLRGTRSFADWIARGLRGLTATMAAKKLGITEADLPYLFLLKLLAYAVLSHKDLVAKNWRDTDDRVLVIYHPDGDKSAAHKTSPPKLEEHLAAYGCSRFALEAAVRLHEEKRMTQFRNKVTGAQNGSLKDALNEECQSIDECIAMVRRRVSPRSKAEEKVAAGLEYATGIRNVFQWIHALHNGRCKVRDDNKNGSVGVAEVARRMRAVVTACPAVCNLPEAVVQFGVRRRLWVTADDGRIALFKLEAVPDFDRIYSEMMTALQNQHAIPATPAELVVGNACIFLDQEEPPAGKLVADEGEAHAVAHVAATAAAPADPPAADADVHALAASVSHVGLQ